ncbi:MAG: hypothetical protein ACOC95_02535 [Planctomycetota bacterium]
MGKVTSTIYTSIYLVVGGAILAMGAEAAALAWGLLVLAAVMAAVLGIAGHRLDALAGQQFDLGGPTAGEAATSRRPSDGRAGRPAA